jgi:hypothetical protein
MMKAKLETSIIAKVIIQSTMEEIEMPFHL